MLWMCVRLIAFVAISYQSSYVAQKFTCALHYSLGCPEIEK
jgi:hypothetical protein